MYTTPNKLKHLKSASISATLAANHKGSNLHPNQYSKHSAVTLRDPNNIFEAHSKVSGEESQQIKIYEDSLPDIDFTLTFTHLKARLQNQPKTLIFQKVLLHKKESRDSDTEDNELKPPITEKRIF